MFQSEWNDDKLEYPESNLNLDYSLKETDELMLLEWEEHCLECSPPLCYSTCSNYLERADKKCKLFENGIKIIKNPNSKLKYYAKLKFRKWGKLEIANLSYRFAKINKINRIQTINSFIIQSIKTVYKILPFLNYDKKRRLNGAYTAFKGTIYKLFSKQAAKKETDYSYIFKYSCYSYSLPFKFIFESGSTTKFSFIVNPGTNYFEYEIPNFNPKINQSIKLFPENDFRADLIIGICDILRVPKTSSLLPKNFKPKAVVWDLDNTIWEGILIEDGETRIKIRNQIIETIKYLDSVGIINSIISKNDMETALGVLKNYDLDKYFVFPKINWNSKSNNFKELLTDLNIGEDTIIFIDDNPFEREEVLNMFPKVLVLDENAFPGLLSEAAFKLIPTTEAKERRLSYKAEEKRSEARLIYANDYLSFLKNCQMEIILSKPKSSEELARAKELLSRTNQLNLSGKKVTDEEFQRMYNDPLLHHFIFKVSDKFGNYGTVGYLNLVEIKNKVNDLEILNLVISCRVAQKKVENAVICILSNLFQLNTESKIFANYNKTSKNSPILESMLEMGFELSDNRLELTVNKLNNCLDLFKVQITDNI